MTANVEIITGRRDNVLRAPTIALRFRPRAADRPDDDEKPDPRKPTAYLVSSDPFRPKPTAVKTGLLGDDYVEVVSGLKMGDKLVVRSRSTVKNKTSDAEADEEEGGGGHPTS